MAPITTQLQERQVMKAIYFEEFKGPLRIESVADPTVPDDGVVIKVEATGLCRSDWHGWQGHDSDVQPPHVPGHEWAGIVVAAGRDVKRWKGGERVTAPFMMGCGSCVECMAGHHQVCEEYFQPGFTGWGSFAEYVALPYADANLVPLPEALSFIDAAALGCRFTTSFRGVIAQGRLSAGEWLAVYGCGGVGLSAIMIGNALGANVIAIDIDEEKLALARSLGAVDAINAHDVGDVPEAVRELTGGGSDVSVDALGSVETARNGILGLRRRGRHVQIGLLTAHDGLTALPMGRVIAWELEILGSHGMQAHAYPALMAMIASGKLAPGKLIGQTVGLGEAIEVLEAMETFKGTGITVIDTI